MNYRNLNKDQLIEELERLNRRVQEFEHEERMRSKTINALRESNDRFSALIEEAPDAIILVDPNTGMVLYANPFSEELLKGNHEEIIGKFQEELFPSRVNDDVLDNIDVGRIRGGIKKYPRRFENTIKRCDGVEIPVEASAKTLLVDGDLLLMCILRDMTQHKKLESDLRKAKEAAERSDKLKSDFLAQISHEVRTPINTIVNFTNIYREDILSKFDEEQAVEINYGFKVINKAADRLIRTLDLMVNLSEVSSESYNYRPEILDLIKDVINPLSKDYKTKCETKGLNFNLIFSEERLIMEVDKFSVYQILENIYNNAYRFTESGDINTTIKKETDKTILIISDTGIGIHESYLPYIYDPFTQEEQGYTRSFEGNGLGLALVKKYCELNNIEIAIKSRKNFGTDIFLSFPKK